MILFSQSTVLDLTCNDNHEELKELLNNCKGQHSLETTAEEKSNDYVQRNPILLSVLQGHKKCTELLHDFGYRIPQKVIESGNEAKIEVEREGEQEEKRRNEFCNTTSNSCNPSWNLIKMAKSYFQNLFTTTNDDQVQSVLDLKGYADPNYISIAFVKEVARLKEDERWRNSTQLEEEMNSEEHGDIERQSSQGLPDFKVKLEDLQKLDPLRIAFDLAATAEDFTNNFQGIVELKKNYEDIKEGLELFTHSLLSQCRNQEEAGIIMKHNPRDNDDDDLDPEEQNWQKALYERRKSFVGHPFYQQSLWQQLLGNGRLSACFRKNRAWFNIIFVPYTLIFFTFLPLVVLLDIIFGNADLLFVTPEVLKERKSKPDKLPLSGHFRKQIHTKVYRVIMHHWSQLVFAIILYLVVLNPNKTEENRMGHWYNYLAGIFSVFLLFDGLRSLNVRRTSLSGLFRALSLKSSFLLVG